MMPPIAGAGFGCFCLLRRRGAAAHQSSQVFLMCEVVSENEHSFGYRDYGWRAAIRVTPLKAAVGDCIKCKHYDSGSRNCETDASRLRRLPATYPHLPSPMGRM